ncbi:MAG: hypothetical protein ABF723_03345 [Lentilactobacillus hilgardii]|uniref:hypothetical protein n=1 Tax=Lentilactobacillus hilgardii TaxID=1588 RepID=UPI001CC1E10E|nr:hypothetical protein [Lentilactobacillus hilgardii]MCV3740700.1 hypothetical protein [Lentilactobacillus hilgardii]
MMTLLMIIGILFFCLLGFNDYRRSQLTGKTIFFLTFGTVIWVAGNIISQYFHGIN